MLEIGERQRLQMSNAFPRLFHHAQFVADDNWHVMQSCLTELEISKEELEKQASFMKRFYSNPPDEESKSVYYDDEICEILLCREVLLEHIEELLNGGVLPPPNFWKELRERLAAKVNGRIPPNAQHPSLLDQKLNKLFDLAESCELDWIDENNKMTDHYIEARERYFYRQLRIVKSDMWKVWMNHRCELDALHSSAMLGKNLVHFISDIEGTQSLDHSFTISQTGLRKFLALSINTML